MLLVWPTKVQGHYLLLARTIASSSHHLDTVLIVFGGQVGNTVTSDTRGFHLYAFIGKHCFLTFQKLQKSNF